MDVGESLDSLRVAVEENRFDQVVQLVARAASELDSTDCDQFELFLGAATAWGQTGRARELEAARWSAAASDMALRCHGRESLEYARAEKAKGDLHAFRAENRAAVEVYQTVLEAFEAYRPEADAQLALTHSNLGVCLRRIGEFEQSVLHLRAAIELLEKRDGPDATSLAGPLSNLGSVYRERGEYERSRAAHARSVEILSSQASPDESLARSLVNLALLEADVEEFAKARAHAEEALELLVELRGERDELTLDTRLNLASFLNDMGSHEEALQAVDEVARGYRELWGDDDPYLSIAYDIKAQILADAGRSEEAIALAKRSQELTIADGGADSYFLIYSLAVMTQSHRQAGEDEAALKSLTRSIDITKGEFGADSPLLIPLFLDLSELALDVDEDAETPLRSAQELLEGAWSRLHPWRARSEWLQGRLAEKRSSPEGAIEHYLNAENVAREGVWRSLSALEERRALRLAAGRVRGLDAALSLLGSNTEAVEQAWGAHMRSRGIVLDAMAARRRSFESGEDSLLQATRARFVNLTLREVGEDGGRHRKELEQALLEMDRAERDYAAASLPSAPMDRPDFTALLDRLGPEVAIVSYVVFTGADGVGWYGAFTVAASEQRPRWQRIGAVDEIDELVRRWREQAAWGEGTARGILEVSRDPAARWSAYVGAARALHDRVWLPLPASTRTARRVHVVPAGALQLLAFDALLDQNDEFLVDGPSALSVLNGEDSLLRESRAAAEGILVVGDPQLGDALPDCLREPMRHLKPLSGARQEAEAIAELWSEDHPVELLLGPAATESRVRRDVVDRGLLHFATHGFVLQSPCGDVDFPLVRSGIVLSGDGKQGFDDGWWSAEEISTLDLRGVDCVILSACDTALGELRHDGEGIYGLRRAVEIAGARGGIVALWAVDDQATREWMLRLHRNIASGGVDPLDAARMASGEILAERRSDGRTLHPYYWSAFLAVGPPRQSP